MEIKAEARNVRLTSRKARQVINLIRNKTIQESLYILKNVNKKASPIIEKVLNSAISNAENNFKLNRQNLVVSKAYINAGSIIKRLNPRARGRADSIHKKLSHVTIFLSERKG